MTFKIKATERHFPFVLSVCIMLCKVVLTFESVDEILQCDPSDEIIKQYFSVVLFTAQYKVVQTFEPVAEILRNH